MQSAASKQLHQRFHRSQIGDSGNLPQVLARQLLQSQGTPAMCEARVPSVKRLGESTVFPQRIPIRIRDFGRWMNLLFGQIDS